MDIVSHNYELTSLNTSCGNENITDDSYNIAVEVLANLLSESYRKEKGNAKRETDSLNMSNTKQKASFANNLSSGKSMASSYLQPTDNSYHSNINVINDKSLHQHQSHIAMYANKAYSSAVYSGFPSSTSKPELSLPSRSDIDINNKSNLPYLNRETMMKIHPDNVDSLLVFTRSCNNSKTFKLKKVKLNEILNYLNDKNRTRSSSILSNVSTDNSCSTNSLAPLIISDKLTKKQLIALLEANTRNRSREYSSSQSQFLEYQTSNKSTDDSQHLQSTDGLYFESSLEERSKSCLPLKKRKILKSTFQTTKQFPQLFKPHSTNISVVTGDKEHKIILIYKSEQSQPLSGKDETLKKKIEIALKQDEDGDLPLHIAVAHKNLAVIGSFCKLIQRSGKTVDRFNKNKLTPLHLGVKMNYSKGVRKLIKMGADVNLSDGNGNSAVHLAVSFSHFECFDVILKTCSLEVSKPNLDSHNYEGLALLHTAVQKQNIEMIRKLLKAGANPDSKDYKSGRTPLFFAVENQNQDIIKLLLENNASVDIQNFAGYTPFLVANGRKYQEICKLLCEWGADAHGMVFDDLACNYKTSTIKYQLKNKLVANQSSQNNNLQFCEDLQCISLNENVVSD